MFAAALGFAVAYVCQIAISPLLHRLTFSPERLLVLAMLAVLMLPFWIGFEFLCGAADGHVDDVSAGSDVS